MTRVRTGDHGGMVDIDEDTQKALMLFNRRDEAEKQAAAVAKRLAKAERAKDEAAEAVKRLQGSGGETLAEAEAAWREALETWQNIRDGKEPVDEAPAEDVAEGIADEVEDADADADATDATDATDEAEAEDATDATDATEPDAEPVDSTEPEPEPEPEPDADAEDTPAEDTTDEADEADAEPVDSTEPEPDADADADADKA